MMKLTKIYQQVLKEELTYRHANSNGAEDDEYEIGMVKEDSKYKSLLKYSAYDNLEMSTEYLKKLISDLNSLPNTLTLYRVVFLQSKKDLRDKELGSHYVLSKNDLDGAHYVKAHKNAKGEPFILTVKANKSDIDEMATLKHNMQYPHEKEITLKNKGANAKLIDIKPFKSKKFDFEDELSFDDGFNDFGNDFDDFNDDYY